MRKRRSTVYVSPGKDVTLYVPVETPPAVIEFLNRLKMEGAFSQGVIDIVTKYVHDRQAVAAGGAGPEDRRPDFAAEVSGSAGRFESECGQPADWGEPVVGEPECNERTVVQEPQSESGSTPTKKLNMVEIFRQARANSGKLADSSRE